MPQTYHTTATPTVTATPLDAALSRLDEAARLLRPAVSASVDPRAAAALLSHATGLALDLPNPVLLECLAAYGVGPGEAQTAARAIVSLAQAVVAHCQGRQP